MAFLKFFNKAPQPQPDFKPAKEPAVISITNSQKDGVSKSGETVPADDAMTLDAVMCCVNVLAQSLASLPLTLMVKEDGQGAAPAKKHPVYRLLKKRPNKEQTSYEFRHWLMVDSILRGCGYAQIIRSESGEVLELWPLLAQKVKPLRDDDGELWFSYGDSFIPDSDMLRVQVLPHGGVIGKSIVGLQAATLGLARANESSAAEFFANGIQSSTVINYPTNIDQTQADRFQEALRSFQQGKGKRHNALVLEETFKATPFTVNAQESQILESRKHSRSVIAGLFRVPAHMINDLEKATFSNIEHQDLSFIKHTITPWLVNWEQRLEISLLTEEEQDTHFFKFNLNALSRGDMPSRFTAYSTGINCGIYSINEVRELEDLPAIENGSNHVCQGAIVSLDSVFNPKPEVA